MQSQGMLHGSELMTDVVLEDLQERRDNEKEFSFFRKEIVPSPLKADADFMMSADGNSQHVRNTSESGLSVPYANLSTHKQTAGFQLRV